MPYTKMILLEFVPLATHLVNVVKKELEVINVLLAQMEPISSTEFVELAQLDTGQMMKQILVILVTNLVLNVMVEL